MLQKSPMYAYIPATDVARARQFYEQKIGFKDGLEQAGGVYYACGNGTSCFLYPTPNAGTSKASQAFWQVADVEVEVAELKKRGVKFEDYDMQRSAIRRSGRGESPSGCPGGRRCCGSASPSARSAAPCSRSRRAGRAARNRR